MRPELGVRTEHEVDAGTGPLDVAGGAIAPLEDATDVGLLPLRAHVEQADDEVVGQGSRPVG